MTTAITVLIARTRGVLPRPQTALQELQACTTRNASMLRKTETVCKSGNDCAEMQQLQMAGQIQMAGQKWRGSNGRAKYTKPPTML